MKLAHTCDDCLSGFLVGIAAESGILFSKLCKSNAHLFLTCLGLGFNRNTDNGIREVH